MKKKILCIVGWWPSGGNATGIFIKEHVRAIQLLNEVQVIYVEVHKGKWELPKIKQHFQVEDGIPVHRIRIDSPVRRFGVSEWLVRSALSAAVDRIRTDRPIDIVHVHVRTDETEQIKNVTKDLPIVITEHNSFYHLGIRQLPAAKASRIRNSIRNWFDDDRIRSVMPVSRDLGQVLHRDYMVAKNKIKVIPNVASEEFRPAQKDPRPPYRLLLAAVWRPPKDHDVFIQAIKLLPSGSRSRLSIEWAGYGPDLALIQDRCRKELADVQITFPGAMTKSDLARSMQQAHLFVLPTRADNLPCVVLESHCCGTPVISMNVNGVPELIDETNGILVPPEDPPALARAILAWMEDPGMFDPAMIANTAEQRYSRSVIAKQIDEVYSSIERSSSES